MKLPLLIQISSSFVPMQFNTAFGFFTCGIILLLLGFKKEKWVILPGFVLIIGALITLYEYISGVTWSVFDEFFVIDNILVKTPYPGRMAPATALCFFLAGVITVIPRSFNLLKIGLVSAIWSIAVLAFISYLIGIEETYGIGALTRMALHTVVGFMVVGSGLIVFILYTPEDRTDDNLWEALPFIAAVVGVVLSLFFYYSTRELVDRQNYQYFQGLVSDSENALYRRFVVYRQSLLGGLGLFHSSEKVTRDEWRTYVSALNIDQYLQGINGIGYIDYVHEDELDSYLEEVRRDDAPDFKNYPETGFDDKFIIKYIEPFQRNKEALGLDIGFESRRREAAERAKETGQEALSRKIVLVQDKQKRAGFLLLIPYYERKGARSDFKGWVYAPFIGEYFLKDIAEFSKRQVDLAVYDGLEPDPNTLIYAGRSFFDDKKKPAHSMTTVIDIAGRKWTIRWQTTKEFVPRFSNKQPFFILILGVIVTFFLTVMLQQLIYRRELVAHEVVKKAGELDKTRKRLHLIMENIPDLIFIKDDRFRIVEANPAFLHFFAPQDRDGIIGTTVAEKLSEEEAARVLQADLKTLREGFIECREDFVDYKGHKRIFMTKKASFEDSYGQRYIVAVARDMTELYETQEKLRENEKRFDLAMQAANIGLWDWDYSTDNFYFNDQFFIMLGYKPNEYPGHFDTIKKLVHKDDLGPALENLDKHIEGEREAFETIVRMKRKSGEWAWISVQGKILSRDDKGFPLRIIGTHIDITALKKSQKEAEKAREEAKYASLMKSEFVANMSHELRTPLNGIIGVTELLEETNLTDKQEGYLDIIRSSGNRLLSLVNDVLDFSKIEAGMIVLKPEATALRELVEETVKIHALQAIRKNIELGVGYDPDIPEILIVDGLRIQQILTNLLGNAIKFTDDGRVLLGVHLKKKTKHTAKIRFKVIDQGMGIPADKINNIFQKFIQVEPSTVKGQAGTGLGLAITRELVELMGGKVHVESVRKEGSVFWFDLTFKIGKSKKPSSKAKNTGISEKAHRSPDRIKKETQSRDGQHEDGQGNILLVEDEEVNRAVARELLEQMGYRVDIAKNGREAIDKIKSEWKGTSENVACKYDLVFMDCMMPAMDGYQTTAKIRQYEKENNLPPVFIVALTAKVFEEAEKKYLIAGMNDYFPKPIKKKYLQEKMDLWLSDKDK